MKNGRSVSGRVLKLQDEERRRLAGQLHNTTGQNIAALQMSLSMLAESTRLSPGLHKVLVDSQLLAQTCVREIRDLSSALHPPLLDEAGLPGAVRAFAAEHSNRTGAVVDLELPPRWTRLRQDIEITLYRLVEHALTSGGRCCAVRLSRDSRTGVLEIEGPATVRKVTPEVRERVRLLGGKIQSGSRKLRVTLPVSHAR